MVDEDFKITKTFYPNEEDFKLLRKKGSVPYSFYKSHESFNETNLTPEMFYNDLKDEMEPKETYEKAKKIWEHFNCKNHGEFIDLYLKSDVMLLSDCFERFREINMKHFKIDPCHCYSAPGLTWQAGLKYTDVELDLLPTIDHILFFENCIRGGVSGIMGSRYAKSEKGDIEEATEYKLLYVDANNLYGWAMMEPQPYQNFEFLDPNQFNLTKESILGMKDDNPIGCYFEVDLEYPNNIKEKTKNLPLCPEQIFIPDELLSFYQLKVLNNKKRKDEKLMLTQFNKNKYILHYRLLKFYLRQGMELKKVHRIIKFKQSKWLKPYIEFNTNQRMKATTDFEKDFFKLMNNAYYGKTCENIRNRQEVHLLKDLEKITNYHNKPNFSDEKIFDENLAALLMRKTRMKFDKPIYIGATVLELSKLLMYEFYYDILQPYFGEKNLELLYMDTDSFVLKIKTDDLNRDLYKLRESFDFSNYPKDHPLFDSTKKKIPGYFKDELGGEEMIEFIALRSKMYAFRTKDSEEKKLKGISKHVIKKHITFEDYKKCLFDEKNYQHKMRSLRSERHEMFVEEVNKISLSPFDDKRFIEDDGITTLPFGYPKNVLFTIEGNIASGKSTLLKNLSEFDDVVVLPEPLEKWQNWKGKNMLDLLYKDQKNI